MGQSAGAFSVAFHLVLPGSKGHFHKGVVQSGAPLGRPSNFILLGELKPMEGSGVEFASEVGARLLAELRAMSPRVLVEADSKSPSPGSRPRRRQRRNSQSHRRTSAL